MKTGNSALLLLAKDTKGVTGIIFALVLLPVFGIVGGAVDYTMAARAKSALAAAADAAALATVKEVATYAGSSGYGGDGQDSAKKAGENKGKAVYASNVTSVVGYVRRVSISFDTKIDKSAAATTAKYSGASPTYFSKIFGMTEIKVSGTITATYAMPKYKNFYFIVDNSQSMGLAATNDDISRLEGLTGGCAFGCHEPDDPSKARSNQQIARDNGVTLRIDVVRNTIGDIVEETNADSRGGSRIKFAIYTMQGALVSVQSLSGNYKTVAEAAKSVDLGPMRSGDTDFVTPLQSLQSIIPEPGDGSSPSNAENYVFILTDGVRDVGGPCAYGHCTSAFDPALCTPFKEKGNTVGVVYTTFLPMPAFNTYNDLVAPFVTTLGPNLKLCASAGYFYEGSDATTISAAMKAMFHASIGKIRLTQ